MKKLILLSSIICSLLIGYMAYLPPKFNSQSYSPTPSPALTGAYEQNKLLSNATLLAQGEINNPEDVAVDKHGRVYGGTVEGKIVRINTDGNVEDFYVSPTQSRPLGLHFDLQENLIVADAYKGLTSISPEGKSTVLTNMVEGEVINFADDVDIASDGTIYFTDASTKYPIHHYIYDFFESKPYGRLLSYSPESKETKVLLDELYFANGVAISQNEDFLLINETTRYRITRYWLSGEKAGQSEIFMDNLPGIPDGISSNKQGRFWVAFATPRNALLDSLHPIPFIKDNVTKLPEFIWKQPHNYGFVMAINEQGEVLKTFHDPSGKHLKMITSVQEHDGAIYMGTLDNDRVGKLDISGMFE